jgi:hypothetical protein
MLDERIPCPHPAAYREGANCHLCGGTGFVLPGAFPWPPITPVKTVDVRHHFRGIWSDGGVCRVRVYEALARPPVVVLSELDENCNTSVTNLIEHLAYDVLLAYLPHRLEAIPPAVVLEHYPPRPDRRRRSTSIGSPLRRGAPLWSGWAACDASATGSRRRRASGPTTSRG